MEILWKDTVSAEFRANCPQNFHTKKLCEILLFCALLLYIEKNIFIDMLRIAS